MPLILISSDSIAKNCKKDAQTSQFVLFLLYFFQHTCLVLRQGQARGYGRITHIRGRTSGGHYFQDLLRAKPLDIHHFLGYQMKDLDIVFPRIPISKL